MNDIDELKAKISATKAKILVAEAEHDRDLILAHTNYLTELRKNENILLAGSGNLLSYWRSISMS